MSKGPNNTFTERGMTVKNFYALYAFIISFILGGAFIYLFCWKPVGISHLIFYFVYMVAAVIPVFVLEPMTSFKKFTPILFFLPFALILSTVFLYRLDQGWLTLAYLTIPVMYWVILSGVFHIETFKNFSFFSFIMLPFLLPIAWLGDIMEYISNYRINIIKDKKISSWFRRAIKGVVVATPFLVLFAILLSSADQVFAKMIRDILKDTFGVWFEDCDAAVSTITKLIVGVVVAFHTMVFYFSLWNRNSVLVKLLKKNSDKAVVEMKRSWDVISSSVFLFMLNILFITFVIVQIRYIFGGESNVLTHDKGFTYSEYARRGFKELMMVALLTYVLIATLNLKVYAKGLAQKIFFRSNFVMMLLSSLVITYSAFSRINLYNSIYGLTGLRLLVVVAICVTAMLFVFLLVSSFLAKPKKFVSVSTTVLLSMASLMWLLTPVDYVVSSLNKSRYVKEDKIDFVYLTRQSDEVIPVMLQLVEGYNTEAPDNVSVLIMAELQHRWEQVEDKEDETHWQSFNFLRQYNEKEMKRLFEGAKTDWAGEAEGALSEFLNDYSKELLAGNYERAYKEYWSANSKSLDLRPLEKVTITQYEFNDVSEYSSWESYLGDNYWRGITVGVDVEYTYETEYTSDICSLTYYGSTNYNTCMNWSNTCRSLGWAMKDHNGILEYIKNPSESQICSVISVASRYDSVYVILENGEWKIKDSTVMTLGNFQDGNKGVYFENSYFDQNATVEHLFERY